eukprot:TRINITY_DN3006_c0_g1_i2.p1 TRINITY_DN3006_c0_g1~~TRINITY_DN3006_c0_g1_i2.p1  ORF type:complete len:181 (+),score=13.38 TRINITY_DN3006_c0_g1_i2:2-544(+)
MNPSIAFWLLVGALALSFLGGFLSIAFYAELFPWNFILVFIGLGCDIAAFLAVYVFLAPALGWKNKKGWIAPWKWILSIPLLIAFAASTYAAVVQCITPERDRSCYGFGIAMPFLLSLLGMAVFAWHLYCVIRLMKQPKTVLGRVEGTSSVQMRTFDDTVDLEDESSMRRTNQHTSLMQE